MCFISTSRGQVLVWGDNTFGQTNIPPNATNVVMLAAGDYHCLALRGDGSVLAWGDNYSRETNVPPDLTNVVSVAAGNTHSLALRSDGTVSSWGAYPNPLSVPPEATNVVGLALGPGALHALVLRSNGTVVDFGCRYYGLTNVPAMATNVVAVAAGSYHALALRADGRVISWGDSAQSMVPSSATNIVAVAAGWYYDAALRADGTVLCWGNGTTIPNSYGFTNLIDLACPFDFISSSSVLAVRRNGTMTQYPSNMPSCPTNKVVAVAAGGRNGLALLASGPPVFPGLPVNRTVTIGSRAYFRLTTLGALPMSYQWCGNGTNIPGATNNVMTLTNVASGMAGNIYTLVASNSLGMATSGPIALSVLPLEAYLQSTTSVTVVTQKVTFSAATVGQGPFYYQWQFNGTNLDGATTSSFILTNAQLADAGIYSVIVSNSYGVLSNAVALAVVPTQITSLPKNLLSFPGGTVDLSIGVRALIPVSYQWQRNGTDLAGATTSSLTLTNLSYDQSGTYRVIYTDDYEAVTNSATLSLVPVAAWGAYGQQNLNPNLTNLMAIACGFSHGLALKTDGTVMGWGSSSSSALSFLSGLSNIIAIAPGNQHSLALKDDGTVVVWPNNSYNYYPTNIPTGLSNVVAVAAGDSHDLALTADGQVFAWGNNTAGQTNVPAGLSNVVAIAAGAWNSMALKADGTVVAWGAGTNNTGNPNYGQSMVPAGLSNVVQIAAGGYHDLALRSDDTLVGWGSNDYGQATQPAGVSNLVAIAAGSDHTLALKQDGTVAVWGYNGSGATTVPVGLTNVSHISAGGYWSLALIGTGPAPGQVPVTIGQQPRGGPSFSVPSQCGHTYALEFKNSLADSEWHAFPLVAGTGRKLTLNDNSTPGSQRFYRVRRW